MFKLNDIVNSNIAFASSFVDLKVVGWKSYEKALNAYTHGFYSNQLAKATEGVEKLAETMKKTMERTKNYV
jgi:hypothetical protein